MSNFPLTKTLLWSLFKGDYETAASVVKNRINFSRVKGDYGYYNNCFPIITGLDKNCTDLSQVSCIMNVYYKEALAKIIPQYDPSNLYKSNRSKATIAAETEKILQHVTRISGQAYFRVKEVIDHLYWATWDDASDRLSYQYIAPLFWEANKGKLEKPEDIGSGMTAAGEAITGSFDAILTAGKWILIIGSLGVAAYFLVPLFARIK